MATESSSEDSLGILVGVDGSAASRAAVHWATHTAVQRHLPLTLVYVVPAPANPLSTRRKVYAQLELPHERLRWILDDAIGVIEETAGHGGPPKVRTRTAFTDPLSALEKLSGDAQLIVVGSPRRGLLRSALCGSIGSRLVQRSHCPVAVVHERGARILHTPHNPERVSVSGW